MQPCRCRGSMAGVHAGCVEAWVEYHRRGAGGLEAPSCPVCRAVYGGTTKTPGCRTLLQQASRCFGQQLWLTMKEAARFVLLGTLLVHFCRR